MTLNCIDVSSPYCLLFKTKNNPKKKDYNYNILSVENYCTGKGDRINDVTPILNYQGIEAVNPFDLPENPYK